MTESVTNPTTKRYAVVTGGNKGIGLGICKQLACEHGVTVILTARDKQRGVEAVEKLKASAGLSDDQIIFQQLDVADPSSVSSLAEYIKTNFGKLDMLVNNAGIFGSAVDSNAYQAQLTKIDGTAEVNWDFLIETYELAEQCVQTNYYGAKITTETLIPLLQSSGSPRIVNVSSSMGKLEKLPNEWAKRILSDEQNLTEVRVDEVLNEYLKNFKNGKTKETKEKGWPHNISAYIVSKAAMNAYTRILAKKYPSICINAVCPGYVKTDINYNTGKLSVEEGAARAVKLLLLPDGGPSGLFYADNTISSF